MRLSVEARNLIGECVDRVGNKSLVARVFGVERATVYKWNRRRKHLKDRKRKQHGKITEEVELAILALRTVFQWGSGRIKQGLQSLPDFMKKALPNFVENVVVSRTSINDVLKKHKLNGYKKNYKTWKFFRASKKDELWQLDLKGPFDVQGKKYWILVCIDDYSRYMLLSYQQDKDFTTYDITSLLERLPSKPEKILTDHGPQFRKLWEKWCKEYNIRPIYAHPYYPQDKGKVERTIRNITEEFVNLLRNFPSWINGKLEEYRIWFNEKRFHRGINTVPIVLYS